MAKKVNYFKRIKEPITSEKEGIELKKETLKYLLISVGVMVISAVLSAFLPFLGIVAFLGFVATVVFGFFFLASKKAIEAFKNLHCDKCNAQMKYDPELVSWKEISRNWSDSTDTNGNLTSVLKITTEITCKCPKCGAVKSFKQIFQTGKIRVDKNLSVRNDGTPTEQFVIDYFNGRMQI